MRGLLGKPYLAEVSVLGRQIAAPKSAMQLSVKRFCHADINQVSILASILKITVGAAWVGLIVYGFRCRPVPQLTRLGTLRMRCCKQQLE
jgi:hypothetical protein